LLSTEEWSRFDQVMADAVDLADAVSDLLMAEGIHQIVQGNFDRAGAAMAIVDKQSLPIEPQVVRTPRGAVPGKAPQAADRSGEPHGRGGRTGPPDHHRLAT